jgi:Cu(I)/Ag(I) efflux system membrane fusion protein
MFPAYAQDLPLLEVGQIVEIAPTALPGEKFKALISFIGQTQDEMTHAVHVRVEVANPKGRLQLDGDATGVVHLQAPEVLTVPRTAVLWPGDAPRVYVEKEKGIYEPRIVQLGRAGDTDWEVLAGLNEGERIVTSGGMLIDGQAQLDAPLALAPQ